MSAARIVAAVAAVALAACAALRRKRLTGERLLLLAAAAVALAVYASGALSSLPDAKSVIHDVAEALGAWTYALVGVLAFLETGAFVGLVAPGETVVMVAGVIAGEGQIDIVALIGLVWACAFLGDATSFLIGRRAGRGFLVRHGPRVKITPERLERVERYFERHGGATILIGRFIGLVRALAPFVAGASQLPYRRFAPFSIVGTGLWSALYSLLGYLFYRSFDRVAGYAGQATAGLAITVAVVAAGVVAYRRRREIAAWMEKRRTLRPVVAAARRVAPEARFLGRRFTPGGLGLELTTALAVTAVGAYVFVLYAALVSGGTRLTPVDRQLGDLAHDVRASALTGIAKTVTSFGTFPVVLVVAVFTVALLAPRRRPAELAAFLAGTVLVVIGLHLAKAGVDRPRPAGGLVHTEGSSFPSGHAVYSTVWVAAAVALTRVVPGLGRDAGLVIAAVVVAVAIGLSRIYLGVHYWSDVAAGWGLGVGTYGAVAVVALVVSHFRHNDPSGTAPPAAPEPS